MLNDKLIYASDARKAILKADPSAAYCIDSIPGVDAVPRDVYDQVRFEKDVAISQLESYGIDLGEKADVTKVVHGHWKLEVRSFYCDNFDESIELAVYILASCSECGRQHPDNNQVFSKRLYAPEDADDDFRFDQAAEREKALTEFMQRGYKFANYCPSCGAHMDLK
jgi:hypothetical protein